MKRFVVVTTLLGAAACAPAPAPCYEDAACTGEGEICAYGACAVIACNADAECGDHRCEDGLCRPGPARVPSIAAEADGAGLAPPCPQAVFAPADGADAISVIADVRAALPTPADAADAVLALEDDAGAPVFTTPLVDGATRVAVPAAPLAGGRAYTAVLTLPGCTQRARFTTDVPAPVPDTAHAPRTVLVDLGDVDITPAAARAMLEVISPEPLRIALAPGGGTLAFSDDGTQERCDPTLTLVGDVQNPLYAVTGALDGELATKAGVRALALRGVSRGPDVELGGVAMIDARLVAHHMLDGCVPGAAGYPQCASIACAVVADVGLTCGPCADGAPWCVTWAMHGTVTQAAELQPLSREQVCADEACTNAPACR